MFMFYFIVGKKSQILSHLETKKFQNTPLSSGQSSPNIKLDISLGINDVLVLNLYIMVIAIITFIFIPICSSVILFLHFLLPILMAAIIVCKVFTVACYSVSPIKVLGLIIIFF